MSSLPPRPEKMIEAEVTKAVTFGKEPRIRYAFKAVAEDGCDLLAFVTKEKWETFKG